MKLNINPIKVTEYHLRNNHPTQQIAFPHVKFAKIYYYKLRLSEHEYTLHEIYETK